MLAASVLPSRYDRVDALRALAMIWMAVFHFCFDLSHFGWWPQNFRADPFWTMQRTAIVSLFLFCAGLGQAIAWQQGQGWPRFARRWWQVAGCAALVTLGSYLMFPRSFIYFGVLHGMAVMLVLARLTAPWRGHLWWLGALALGLPWLAQPLLQAAGPEVEALFNAKALNWLGLVTRKPFTEDYVPLLPWLGVMWWGLATGQWLLRHRPHWMQQGPGTVQAVVAPLAVLGRWSLSFYMLHQPVLIGLILAGGWLLGRAP